MAKRILEVEGRLAGPDPGLNEGPDLFNAIKPNSVGQSINWNNPFVGTGINTSFQLMTETWVYVSTAGGASTVYRNRNSGAGVQDQFTTTPSVTGGSANWFFDIGGNFGPTHFDVLLPAGIWPTNQWVHILQASDMTSPVLASRIFEHVFNGVLVPASSRTISTLNNNQNGFADPHAATHNLFLGSSPNAYARYWMIQDFLDITDPVNVAKFIDTTSYIPVQLGPDGSNPTGDVPIIFSQNNILTILENLGSEVNADAIAGTWEDAGHNPTSPARFAHGTAASPNQSGLELTGAALGLIDTQTFSLSMWFKSDSPVAAGNLVIASDNSTSNRLVISYDGTGAINVTARNAAGTVILDADTTGVDITNSTFHHIAISINMAAAVSSDAVRLFVDDIDRFGSVSTFVGSELINLGQTGLIFAILNHSGQAATTRGEFSQFWSFPDVFVDFSVPSVRAKFVETLVVPRPIDLGVNGATPLGLQPLIYTGQGPTFVETTPLLNLNRGSAGGTFTVSRNAWVQPTTNPAFQAFGT